ncbi:MAG: fused MFS/spermidine synthase [Phycisphaerales bacterium]|nr:MAG: fused MFS/spermidine synthase [Phycisphaerales bacterium]
MPTSADTSASYVPGPAPRVHPLVVLLFLVSGAAGLIYQVVWTRYLTTILGSTTQAVSAVVAAFMAGLALGAFLAGRSRSAGPRAIRYYAVLEIGVGIYAMIFPLLMAFADRAYMVLFPLISGQDAATLGARLVISLGLLLLPTSLMGATLPFMVVGVVRDADAAAKPLAILYGINTLGAVAGTLCSGFVLIPLLGLSNSMRVAIALNLGVGLLALSLAPRISVRGKALPSTRPLAGDLSAVARRSWLWLALVLGISGFASIGLEVAWTRALVMFTGNSTYAFATILATFLAGIGLGSVLSARANRLAGCPYRRLGLFQMGIGLVSVVPALVLSHLYYWLAGHYPNLINIHATHLWIKVLQAALVFFVPALLMGTALPLGLALGSRDLHNAARATGSLYALNTIGAIAGALLVGFVGIPALGSLRCSVILAALFLLSGGALVLFARQRESARTGALPWLMLLLAAPMFGTTLLDQHPLSVLKDPRQETIRGKDPTTLFYKEGVNTLSEVVEDRFGARSLFIDGIVQLDYGTDVLRLNRLLAQLPILMHPEPQEVLIIASGVGVTSGAALEFSDVRHVTSVEIAGEVSEATPLFAEVNNNLADSERHQTVIDDGRHFLKTDEHRYEVISTSAIHPKLNAGNASLYRREYFELIRRRLAADGIACHWIPLDMSEREIRDAMHTFLSVFPQASLWFSKAASKVGKYDVLLLGSNEPQRLDYQAVRRRMTTPAARAALRQSGIRDPLDLLGNLILQGRDLRDWVGDDGRIFTDDRPGLEFEHSDIDLDASVVLMIEARRPPPADHIDFGADPEETLRLAAQWESRVRFLDTFLNGDRFALLGDRDAAEREYRSAWEMRPGDLDLQTAIRQFLADGTSEPGN